MKKTEKEDIMEFIITNSERIIFPEMRQKIADNLSWCLENNAIEDADRLAIAIGFDYVSGKKHKDASHEHPLFAGFEAYEKGQP